MGNFGLGLLGVLLGVGGGLLAFWLVSRRFKDHPIASAIFATTSSAIIASAFTPWLNDRLNRQRDDDNWRKTIRQSHLARIKPFLGKEADQLGALATQVGAEQFYMSPGATPEALAMNYAILWQDGNPLGPDLSKHFPDYAREREALKAAVLAHDDALTTLNRDIYDRLPKSLGGMRGNAQDEMMKKCRGHEGHLSIDKVTATGFEAMVATNKVIENANNLSLLPFYQGAARAFASFPDAEMKRRCEKVVSDTAAIAAKAKELSTTTRDLAEGNSLPGDCRYLKTE